MTRKYARTDKREGSHSMTLREPRVAHEDHHIPWRVTARHGSKSPIEMTENS